MADRIDEISWCLEGKICCIMLETYCNIATETKTSAENQHILSSIDYIVF